MMGLTRDMRDAMRVIQELTDAGRFPSIREIAHELCLPLTQTARLLAALKVRGFVKTQPRRWRSIEILRRVPMADECRAVRMIGVPAWLLQESPDSQSGAAP